MQQTYSKQLTKMQPTGSLPNHHPVNESPLVSIIIVTFNNKSDLDDCFASLEKINYSNFEVIVVDNASKDRTAKLIRKNYPWVNLIENPNNSGFTGGSNLGAMHAKGELLAFLNPDTKVDKNWLNELVKPFKENKNTGSCGSLVLFWDQKHIQSLGGAYNRDTGYTIDLFFGRDKRLIQIDRPWPVFYCCGAAFIVRKELFKLVNCFDNDYFMYFDEVDLGWRIRLAGYDNFVIPTSIVYHKVDELRAHASKYRFLVEKNSLDAIIKNYETPNLLLYGLKVLSIRFIASAVFFLTGKPNYGFPIVRAFLNILSNFKQIWRKRLVIQRQRVKADIDIFGSSYYLTFSELLRTFFTEVKPSLE